MVKKLLSLFAFAVLLAQPAIAQTLTMPPDAGSYNPRSVTYTPTGKVGDGSGGKGGVAPAFTTIPEGADPSPTIPAGLITSDAAFCTVSNAPGAACTEKKTRFHANVSKFLYDDPVRYWGQPGKSHCHEFFGNLGINAYSTHRSLRVFNASSASGAGLNGSGYWEPCTSKTIGGKKYAIPSGTNVIYYSVQQEVNAPIVNDLQPLHSKLRFILGTNMDDPDDTKVKAEIAAANALLPQPIYNYTGNGFLGYVCERPDGTNATVIPAARRSSSIHAKTFNLGGVDPYNGACIDGSRIYPDAFAPTCWDGWNVASIGGYWHQRYPVANSDTGREVCPDGWYKVPHLSVKSFHSTRGPSDYMTWSLESDAMMAAKLAALGTPRTVYPGESWHADWMNGWNHKILKTWMEFCIGTGGGAPHECNDSTISATQRLLLGNTPTGYKPVRTPQVNLGLTVDTNNPAQLHLIDLARTATHNMRGM